MGVEMDQSEFQQLADRLKQVLDERGHVDKYYFQLITHDGANGFQTALSNINENDPVGLGKSFSRSSELLLMQFREWLLK